VSGAPGAGDTERGMASGVADILEAMLAGHPHLRDNDQLALDIKHIRLIVALLRRLAAAPAPDPLDGEEVEATLIDCCQLLDGWHQDGTAWSAWDESMRQRIGKLLHAVYERNRERGIRATAYTPPAATPLTGASDEASGRAGEDGR